MEYQKWRVGPIAIVASLPKVDQLGAIYAPISMFQFHRPFTNEEFFMIKLCSICD